MVQYRDLNAPPSRMLADVVADMKAQERQSKTGDAGVKDLGETGDIIWPRWDGGEESVREVGENVEAARASIAELNDVILPELADELDTARTDLQQKLDAANARIDDIIVDGGGAGNFTTYSINEPSTAGTGDGDQWFRVVNGEVIGQWRWDGAAWVPVTLTDAIIAGIDLSKLVSNGNLSEVVANKMFADLFAANKITAQELAVGAVTAENIASGAIHADEIVGGSFTGETFEGGTFTGGLFKTSDALPGKVEFADDAYVTHFGGGGTFPGLRITPVDTSETNLPAAIGPSTNGLTIFGGRSISGGSSIVQCNPDGSFLRTYRPNGSRGGAIQTSPTASLMRTYREDGTIAGEMQTSPTESFMRTSRENGEVASEMLASATSSLMRTNREGGGIGGSLQTTPATSFMRTYSGNSTESGWVQARPQDAELAYVDASNTYFSRIKADESEAFLYTRAGGTNRYLSIDANGVWVKTNKSGSWEWWNLEETASDTGWRTFPMNSALAGAGSPAYRIKSGTVFFRGSVTLPGASWSGGWTTIGVLPAAATPTFDVQRPTITSAMSQVPETYLQTSTSGQFQVWIPRSVAGTTVIQLSPMTYVAG